MNPPQSCRHPHQLPADLRVPKTKPRKDRFSKEPSLTSTGSYEIEISEGFSNESCAEIEKQILRYIAASERSQEISKKISKNPNDKNDKERSSSGSSDKKIHKKAYRLAQRRESTPDSKTKKKEKKTSSTTYSQKDSATKEGFNIYNVSNMSEFFCDSMKKPESTGECNARNREFQVKLRNGQSCKICPPGCRCFICGERERNRKRGEKPVVCSQFGKNECGRSAKTAEFCNSCTRFCENSFPPCECSNCNDEQCDEHRRKSSCTYTINSSDESVCEKERKLQESKKKEQTCTESKKSSGKKNRDEKTKGSNAKLKRCGSEEKDKNKCSNNCSCSVTADQFLEVQKRIKALEILFRDQLVARNDNNISRKNSQEAKRSLENESEIQSPRNSQESMMQSSGSSVEVPTKEEDRNADQDSSKTADEIETELLEIKMRLHKLEAKHEGRNKAEVKSGSTKGGLEESNDKFSIHVYSAKGFDPIMQWKKTLENMEKCLKSNLTETNNGTTKYGTESQLYKNDNLREDSSKESKKVTKVDKGVQNNLDEEIECVTEMDKAVETEEMSPVGSQEKKKVNFSKKSEESETSFKTESRSSQKMKDSFMALCKMLKKKLSHLIQVEKKKKKKGSLLKSSDAMQTTSDIIPRSIKENIHFTCNSPPKVKVLAPEKSLQRQYYYLTQKPIQLGKCLKKSSLTKILYHRGFVNQMPPLNDDLIRYASTGTTLVSESSSANSLRLPETYLLTNCILDADVESKIHRKNSDVREIKSCTDINDQDRDVLYRRSVDSDESNRVRHKAHKTPKHNVNMQYNARIKHNRIIREPSSDFYSFLGSRDTPTNSSQTTIMSRIIDLDDTSHEPTQKFESLKYRKDPHKKPQFLDLRLDSNWEEPEYYHDFETVREFKKKRAVRSGDGQYKKDYPRIKKKRKSGINKMRSQDSILRLFWPNRNRMEFVYAAYDDGRGSRYSLKDSAVGSRECHCRESEIRKESKIMSESIDRSKSNVEGTDDDELGIGNDDNYSISSKRGVCNPFEFLATANTVKIPVLFEELCKDPETVHPNISVRVVLVGIADVDKKESVDPFKKLVRKFSRTESSSKKKKYAFGVTKCECQKNARQIERSTTNRNPNPGNESEVNSIGQSESDGKIEINNSKPSRNSLKNNPKPVSGKTHCSCCNCSSNISYPNLIGLKRVLKDVGLPGLSEKIDDTIDFKKIIGKTTQLVGYSKLIRRRSYSKKESQKINLNQGKTVSENNVSKISNGYSCRCASENFSGLGEPAKESYISEVDEIEAVFCTCASSNVSAFGESPKKLSFSEATQVPDDKAIEEPNRSKMKKSQKFYCDGEKPNKGTPKNCMLKNGSPRKLSFSESVLSVDEEPFQDIIIEKSDSTTGSSLVAEDQEKLGPDSEVEIAKKVQCEGKKLPVITVNVKTCIYEGDEPIVNELDFTTKGRKNLLKSVQSDASTTEPSKNKANKQKSKSKSWKSKLFLFRSKSKNGKRKSKSEESLNKNIKTESKEVQCSMESLQKGTKKSSSTTFESQDTRSKSSLIEKQDESLQTIRSKSGLTMHQSEIGSKPSVRDASTQNDYRKSNESIISKTLYDSEKPVKGQETQTMKTTKSKSAAAVTDSMQPRKPNEPCNRETSLNLRRSVTNSLRTSSFARMNGETCKKKKSVQLEPVLESPSSIDEQIEDEKDEKRGGSSNIDINPVLAKSKDSAELLRTRRSIASGKFDPSSIKEPDREILERLRELESRLAAIEGKPRNGDQESRKSIESKSSVVSRAESISEKIESSKSLGDSKSDSQNVTENDNEVIDKTSLDKTEPFKPCLYSNSSDNVISKTAHTVPQEDEHSVKFSEDMKSNQVQSVLFAFLKPLKSNIADKKKTLKSGTKRFFGLRWFRKKKKNKSASSGTNESSGEESGDYSDLTDDCSKSSPPLKKRTVPLVIESVEPLRPGKKKTKKKKVKKK